ncbi:MAG TPA: DUF2442 domain-containing protein [Candidatus Rifleibacterium sp.]|nr:DUF2442 domain-containing protein [Candidatus Rifleibacterium sp.]HPT47169.1 DUF2442 domain-containing protein [Candidatus Rifleibacterium sp.]
MITVKSVVAQDDFTLLVRFADGLQKTVDFKPFLKKRIFERLKNPELFKKAFVQCGTVCWDDDTDIPAEQLYYGANAAISELVANAGGQTAFARQHGIPLRTVQNWVMGKRCPPEWLIRILEKITPEHRKTKAA